ncbi:hypothetical protein [Bradyrhizobium sacchari]|uniref:hypothetical protein n=1 Tax=Bradyrhizobium sacchari TaxID=1399419 RepID=UPI00137475A4|nr:hypothetical protein [Bradyrhizobium sacchari]
MSASLQKDSVAPARFLTQFAEFTVEGCDTLESAISALIQRKSATFLWRVATGM